MLVWEVGWCMLDFFWQREESWGVKEVSRTKQKVHIKKNMSQIGICGKTSASVMLWTNKFTIHGLPRCTPPHPMWLLITPPDLRRPPGRGGGRVPWDIPPSCAGSDWRDMLRSSAGLWLSSAAWARSARCCACDSWCSAQTPTGTSPGNSRSSPHTSDLNDLCKERMK